MNYVLQDHVLIFFVNKCNRNNTALSVLHQNIAGLISKTELIELTLNELSEQNACFDILCFSESFIKSGNESKVHISGYHMAAALSRRFQKRGGVCIFCSKKIQSKEIEFVKGLSEEHIFECCGVEIPSIKTIIVCIYRPPTANCSIFFQKLELLLNRLKRRTRFKVVIAGDLNIDTLKVTEKATELTRILINNNFKLHILSPTRRSACLDQIISNIPEVKSATHNICLSDHETAQSITFTVSGKIHAPKVWYYYRRDYHEENIEKFLTCLSSLSWSDVYNEPDVSEAFNTFYNTFRLFYDLCFPTKKIKFLARLKPKTWFTQGIKKSVQTKRKLRFTYYKSSNDLAKNSIKSKYYSYSKLLKRCIHQSQKLENSKFVTNSKNIGKASWEIIKNVTRDSPRNSDIHEVLFNNDILSNPIDIANAFNDYSINITNSINYYKQNYDTSNIKTCSDTIFLIPTDCQEIVKIIQLLNSTKSTGYDDIQTHILKRSKLQIAPVLSYLINMSLESGCFPEPLKVTLIKPLHKKGCKTTLGNYRPISLIPVLSKIFEKVMLKRLTEFLDRHNIIKPEQYGFRKGKSTCSAAFCLINNIMNFMDKSKSVTAVFFDMTKAFDFVSHIKLLAKCEAYGLRGVANKWLKSYLSNRMQFVVINKLNNYNIMDSYKSSMKVNATGVPQGSILGPLLFILYVNDLPCVTEFNCTLFADDLSIVIPCKDVLTYNDEINDTINNVISWLHKNDLNVNISKTTYMQFLNKNGSKRPLTVLYKDDVIKESDQTTFLGFTLDNKFHWSDHIDKICVKINSYAYALWKLAKITENNTVIQAYHGYVCSLLRYGIVLWGNSHHAHKALIAQKQCIRAICNIDSMSSCRPWFKKIGLLTVPCMYILEICLFVRCHPGLFKKCKDSCHFNTRQPEKLSIPARNTKLFSKGTYCMAISIYNSLHINMKELQNNMFKRALKKWLVERCFYSVDEFFEYCKHK